jgi:hypothetical protein
MKPRDLLFPVLLLGLMACSPQGKNNAELYNESLTYNPSQRIAADGPAGMVLGSGMAQYPARARLSGERQAIIVETSKKDRILLKPGTEKLLRLHGKNLDQLVLVRAVRKGRQVKGISVAIHSLSENSAVILLKAALNAKSSGLVKLLAYTDRGFAPIPVTVSAFQDD